MAGSEIKTKSILVLDTPTSCNKCKLQYCGSKYKYCILTKYKYNEKYDMQDCPLRQMPDKLDANDWHRAFGGTYKERKAKGDGYNTCIEEILGGIDNG